MMKAITFLSIPLILILILVFFELIVKIAMGILFIGAIILFVIVLIALIKGSVRN